MRNPTWSREELILALDLYFRVNPSHTTRNNPDIVELSEALQSLSIHPLGKRTDSFRNPSGVYMKLCNFLRLDPAYQGQGLRAGGRGELEVWQEYAQERTRLSQDAEAIRRLQELH